MAQAGIINIGILKSISKLLIDVVASLVLSFTDRTCTSLVVSEVGQCGDEHVYISCKVGGIAIFRIIAALTSARFNLNASPTNGSWINALKHVW